MRGNIHVTMTLVPNKTLPRKSLGIYVLRKTDFNVEAAYLGISLQASRMLDAEYVIESQGTAYVVAKNVPQILNVIYVFFLKIVY